MQDEYIITNRIGAYSSSDIHFGNTRRYHGLLVASEDELNRKVIVNRLEERLAFHGREEYLNTNIYKNQVIYPNGHKWLKDFSYEPKPKFTYGVDNVNLTKLIELDEIRNKISIHYKLDAPIPLSFRIKPLLTYRSFHELKNYSDPNYFQANSQSQHVFIQLPDHKTLKITGSYTEYYKENYIYFDFEYPEEAKRGYDFTENLISCGYFVYDLPSGENNINIEFEYESEEFEIHTQIFQTSNTSKMKDPDLTNLHNFLIQRSKDFLIKTKSHYSVIAGYHWFEDWGRDTFISFEGLLLTQKRYDLAKEILIDWTKHIRNGLIANRPELFEYNSLDAALWYIISIYNYWKYTNDDELVKNLLPQIATILEKLILGTDYEIYTLKNGLLITDQFEKSLTWMDAVVDNTPVTPRANVAVEIQMLWFNVLNMYKEMESFSNKSSDLYYLNLLIKNLKDTFNQIFWIEDKQFLADYLKKDTLNAQIRPNALIGLHLPFDILDKEKSKKVLNIIEKFLITPIGIKTLNSEDLDYKGEYKGDQKQRDLAYHNGTVWPWLLGFYLKSYLKYNDDSDDSVLYVKEKLKDFWIFLQKNKLNYIPEVFSADTLEPNGCLTQAWNYATLLEVFHEIENLQSLN